MELLALCPEFPDIKGWLNTNEAEVLFQEAKNCQNGAIVEVGSAFGKSTIALSLGAKSGKDMPVFAIDPHENFEGLFGGQFGADNRRGFYQTMLKYDGWENVRLVNLSSEVITTSWSHKVMLLWIDGDHRYESVKRDIKCWQPHLGKGATVIMDDIGNSSGDPARVFNELIDSGLYQFQQCIGKIGLLKYMDHEDLSSEKP